MIDRILQIIDFKGINKSIFYKETGLSNGFLDKVKDIGASKLELILKSYPEISMEWLLTGKGEMLKDIEKVQNIVNEPGDKYQLEVVSSVPYYDVEFTSSFLEVENDQAMRPTSYISHPFFTGCDLVVRNSGQSMAKLICHGDAVGLVKINNWQEFFPLGEVYGIVTENNFRMIKIITKGETEDYYTLISKPTDSKKDEFPPQQIKKTSIVSIFKVQACSHLF